MLIKEALPLDPHRHVDKNPPPSLSTIFLLVLFVSKSCCHSHMLALLFPPLLLSSFARSYYLTFPDKHYSSIFSYLSRGQNDMNVSFMEC